MKHAFQWSSPARLVFLHGKQLGGSSTIGGSSAMVLLSERHLSRYSVVANTGAAKPTHTPIATAALKTLVFLLYLLYLISFGTPLKCRLAKSAIPPWSILLTLSYVVLRSSIFWLLFTERIDSSSLPLKNFSFPWKKLSTGYLKTGLFVSTKKSKRSLLGFTKRSKRLLQIFLC